MRADKILIWPTALWFIFGPVLGCMWIAAVNYANNLVYEILYLIASLSFVSLFHTWRNLAALRVEHIRIHPAFAGEEVRVEVHLRNASRHKVYGLFFARYGEDLGGPWRVGQPLANLFRSRRTAPLRMTDNRGVRIDAEDTRAVEATFTSELRGLYRFDSLLVRTSYPFGLFRASVRVMVGAEFFIYPKPGGSAVWPMLQQGGDAGRRAPIRRATISPACAPMCRGNRCGMWTGRRMRAGGRSRSSSSPAAAGTNCGWTRRR